MRSTVGILGFGRIARHLRERIAARSDIELAFIFVRDTRTYDEDSAPLHDETSIFGEVEADLVVEAADSNAVAEHGPTILQHSSLMVLSTTALANQAVESELTSTAMHGDNRIYVPHGAVLGTDGLQDASAGLETVHIRTRKNPDNIDFSLTDVNAETIDRERELYDGPTRAICRRYPRNVNSHATIALAGLGFDETRSTLIADPETADATHRIVAEGESTTLEIKRRTTIEGVTGSYTLDSIWGSVRRVLDDRPGVHVL